MMSSQLHPLWQKLLEWLATRGMHPESLLVEARSTPGAGYGLFALKSISPSAVLFTVPASALLNVSTLSPHYPGSLLNAIQMISLHLLLYRPSYLQKSPDPLFGPYISILPHTFAFHPLEWFWNRRNSSFKSNVQTELFLSLPPSATRSLEQLADRFDADWSAVRHYLQAKQSMMPDPRSTSDSRSLEVDYLWAWLNVNTRCIYHRLKISPSDPDNITLCPILDFANHTTGPTHTLPLWPRFRGRNITTLPDEELFLRYGAHANRTLFVEYGFVNRPGELALSDQDDNKEADVQEAVEHLFKDRGHLGTWMKQQLVDEGYWGDWTLHCTPRPAHPSYRLIVALRLYHILPITSKEIPPDGDELLRPWRNMVMGKQELISERNEVAFRETLLQICQGLVDTAASALAQLEWAHKDTERIPENKMDWVLMAWQNIVTLWEEESCVGKAVLESIHQGVEF